MKVLDTDILVGILRKNEDAINKLIELEEEDIAITVFSWQEIIFGPTITENKKELRSALELLNSYTFLNYERNDIFYTIKILTHLKKVAQPIGLIDEMIAGMCLRHKATLVTRNIEHFSRVPNLKIEKW